MKSIRIKGLRSLVDTGDIDLKQLSIAVGKNSSGKSTLLRFFPLIKQTIETKISEPLLWYGRYVDFGDFIQSLSKNSDIKLMEFQFKFTIKRNEYSYNKYIQFNDFVDKERDLELAIQINNNNIQSVYFVIDKNVIKINYGEDNKLSKVIINDKEIDIGKKVVYNYVRLDGKLLPELYSCDAGEKNNDKFYSKIYGFFGHRTLDAHVLISSFIEKFINNQKQDKRLSSPLIMAYRSIVSIIGKEKEKEKEKEKIIQAMNVYLKYELYEVSKDKKLLSSKNIKEVLNSFIKYIEENFEEAIGIFEYSLLPYTTILINDYLSEYFNSSSYIAPLRATAERYYRQQGLNIQDVDPRGDNIPMMIKSMQENEIKEFDKWMEKNFDFKISQKNLGGHISVFIEKNDGKFNIADTGFGYSQIIPIILLLWKNTDDYFKALKIKNHQNEAIKQIVIEQPELHLHPKMQTQLMDVILKITSLNKNIQFLIETHSEIIINHVGRCIEENIITNDKVNVLLFEQENCMASVVKQVTYTSEGYLEQWPIDFFQGGEI